MSLSKIRYQQCVIVCAQNKAFYENYLVKQFPHMLTLSVCLSVSLSVSLQNYYFFPFLKSQVKESNSKQENLCIINKTRLSISTKEHNKQNITARVMT